MGTDYARARCRERLARLARSPQDSDSLRREVINELRRAIGFDRWCAPLVDPDTLVAHTGIGDTDHLAEMSALQLHDSSLTEINNGVALATGRQRVGVLSAKTSGDLASSRRWRECLQRFGTGDELRVAAMDTSGCWGRFDLWRDRADGDFDAEDARLVADVAAVLGGALRRATVRLSPEPPRRPLETGVLIIANDLQVHGMTPAANAWFRLLNPAGVPYLHGIPSLVWSTVGRLVAAEKGEAADRPARARIHTADGNWAIVEAARLEGAQDGFAVTVKSAGIDEILGLVCRSYGLSNRERELVTLVVEGLDTAAIASRLHISRYTVQDHLKSVFGKTGVNGRLELLTSLFAQAA